MGSMMNTAEEAAKRAHGDSEKTADIYQEVKETTDTEPDPNPNKATGKHLVSPQVPLKETEGHQA